MSVNDVDEQLLAAAKSGDLNTVMVSLQSGATKLDLALYISSDQGHLAVVQHCLDHGASQAQKDEALWYAASAGHLPVVECLVNDGADYRAKNSRAVLVAAEEDNLAVTRYFVEHGADLEIIESYGGDLVHRWLEGRK